MKNLGDGDRAILAEQERDARPRSADCVTQECAGCGIAIAVYDAVAGQDVLCGLCEWAQGRG